MLDAVRILTAALILTGVAHLVRAQPVEYDLAIDAAASLSDPGAGGELSAFAPLYYEDEHLLFGDFRAGGFHDTFFNLSVGWGARRLQPSGWIAGWSAFLDRTQINSDDGFDQAGLGLEWLSIDWDVRINGYLADSVEYYEGPSRAVIRNNMMLIEHPLIGANSGTDFEVGYLLGDWKDGAVEWRGYLGGYYFGRGGVGFEPLTGPRVRTELRLFDVAWLGTQSRIVATGQYQWDEVRGSQGLLSVLARVTLGTSRSGRLSRIHRRMVNPVVRQPGAVISRGAWTEQALTGAGTQFAPVALIDGRTPNPTAVVQNLGNNSVVYVSGAAGPIEVSETFRLRNGQRVYGGPGWVSVVGEETGTIAGFEVQGGRPLVRGTNPDRDVFQLGYSHSTVKGLDIDGGRNGIAGKGADHYSILENRISGAVRSSDSELTEASGNGIYLSRPGIQGMIRGNELTGNHVGLHIDGTYNGSLVENQINANVQTGISVAGRFNGEFRENQTNSNGHTGILVDGRLEGTVRDNETSHNGAHGLHVRGHVVTTLYGTNAYHNGGSGILVEGTVTNVQKSMLVENGGYGLLIEGKVHNSLRQNVAWGNGEWGIRAGDVAGEAAENAPRHNYGGGMKLGYVFGRVVRNTASNNGLQGILAEGVLESLSGNVVQGNGHRGLDDQDAGVEVRGNLNYVRDNTVMNNHGEAFRLALSNSANLQFVENVMSGNNGGKAEFVAEMRPGHINTAVVRLRNNVSTNIVPVGTANYERLDPQVRFFNHGGNVGIIGY